MTVVIIVVPRPRMTQRWKRPLITKKTKEMTKKKKTTARLSWDMSFPLPMNLWEKLAGPRFTSVTSAVHLLVFLDTTRPRPSSRTVAAGVGSIPCYYFDSYERRDTRRDGLLIGPTTFGPRLD